MCGKLMTRQSERDLPNTNFAKGIQKGKVMARDFRGILLIMAAVLRSSKGKALLLTRKKFGGPNGIRDWSLLIELLLEWESYLCEKQMKRSHVKRLAKKHVFIMYIMKVVANRVEGMGLKLMKYHAIVHMINEAITGTCCVVADIGGRPNSYFQIKPRVEWTNLFVTWLKQPHEQDVMEFSDDEQTDSDNGTGKKAPESG